MIKPKTADLQLKQRDFMVWWTPTTMTSQTGGRLRAFKFSSYLSPVSDLENNLFLKFSFSMFQTLTTALFASPISFISYLFYFWYFLTWKL